MNHRFFEERLFVDEPLPVEEQILLGEHLQSCERCRALRTAWQELQVELKLTQWLAPREGFAHRWQEYYIRRTTQAQQRRALITFLITSSLAAFFAFPFYLYIYIASPSQPLWMWVVIALYNLSALIPVVEGVLTFVLTVFRAFAQVIPPTMEIAMGVVFVGLMVVWLAMLCRYSYWRLRTQ